MARFKRKAAGCTRIEKMAYEVEWYEKHGKHRDRIKTDTRGHRYVQWDHGWNKRNPYRRESIRLQLADWVAFRVTGIRA